ncbi:ABC transporter ATP-binding protein [Cellulomonas sp. P22]|uniref:ABC transporter ATP-binding protein n=1 Tax=Cellulomonas sp. P22 TaxID=3373189 RepID=UPI003792C51B
MNDSVITVDNVSKRFRIYHERNQSIKVALMRGRRAKFDEFWALRDIGLEIPQGKTFGLVGHNGSGKSTLLKCLAKILVPDTGSIAVRGKVSALLELGAGFHPELSGRDNVYLNGSILGLTKAEIDRKFDDIVDFAGLSAFIDTPVKNYSSGMYVRLGFSVAINVDPDILMVDEVLAVGDEEFQRRSMEKFKEFKDDGRTIVVVSHALGTMRDMCDEVAWLDHGRLQSVGKPGEVVDDYIETSHTDRDEGAAKEGRLRHGSGEIRLEDVELLVDGVPTTTVRTGDDVTFRLRYDASSDVEDAVFGLAIDTLSGQNVTGPNTKDGGLRIDVRRGTGQVDLRVPRLMLLAGTYDVTVASTDSTLTHTFDHQKNLFRFDVLAGQPTDRFGIVSLGGTWQNNGVRHD